MISYAARVSAAAVAPGMPMAGAQASAIAVAQTGDAESERVSAGDSPGDRRADLRETRRQPSSRAAGRPKSTPDIADTADAADIPDGALAERAIRPGRRGDRRGRPAVNSTPETTVA